MSDLQIVNIDIGKLIPDPANARLHSPEQLEYIAASLDRFSQQKPIVVGRDNVIIAGNGTYTAAKDILGWKTIAVVYSDLSVNEARAFGIADNQIALQSDWDLTTLSKHIQDLSDWQPDFDWRTIGFDAEDIAPVVGDMGDDVKELSDFEPPKEDDKPAMAKPIKVTDEMRETIDQAINVVRLQSGDYKMTEGRAIELMAADFLSGTYKKKIAEEAEVESTQEIA